MEAVAAADLLDLWERGSSLGSLDRALLLLGRARPDLPEDGLGTVPLGRRDTEILGLREVLFGGRMTAVMGCPGCTDSLELDFEVADIRPPDVGSSDDEQLRLAIGGREVTVRLPGTDDLAAALRSAGGTGRDPIAVRRALLARIVVDGDAGMSTEAATVATASRRSASDDLDSLVGEAILRADPAAELRLAGVCPSCGSAWETVLDIAGYLWTEIVDAARRVAREVAALAAAYGWREADVLALTPWRRRLYLDLAAD